MAVVILCPIKFLMLNLEWERVIVSLTSATIKVNYRSLKLPRLLSYCVQSSFWCYLHCLVHKAMDLPDLKNKCKQTAIFWVCWLFIHAEGEPDLFWLMSLTNQDMGLFTFLCSSYIEAQNGSWLTVMMRASVGCIVMQMFLYWKFEQALFCVEVLKHHRSVSFVFKHLRIDHFSVVKASSRFI